MRIDELRRHACDIFNYSVSAVDAGKLVKTNVTVEGELLRVGDRKYDLRKFENIYVIGAGKASASMAQGLEELLQDRLTSGIVVVKYEHTLPLRQIRLVEAGHPVPDEAGVNGTGRIIEVLENTTDKDLVICLISGGGSALLVAPNEGITLDDEKELTKLLLECGATINELNAIRKHISRIKGGKLAKLAYPSTLVTLILSDVIGDPLDSIASGPTVQDTTTFNDCINILEKYNLTGKIPNSVSKHFEAGHSVIIAENPRRDDPIFERTHNLMIGNNTLAVRAAREKAKKLGLNSLVLSTFIAGETKGVAKVHAAIAKEITKTGNPIKKPACIVSGGETTVTIRGDGLGGRNQEFALAAAIDIDGLENVLILSGGTDGTDGPTDAAGAIADGNTVSRALQLGLNPNEYLGNNDSYHFFEKLDDLIKTGPTNTNVMDLRLVLVG